MINSKVFFDYRLLVVHCRHCMSPTCFDRLFFQAQKLSCEQSGTRIIFTTAISLLFADEDLHGDDDDSTVVMMRHTGGASCNVSH